MHAITSPRYARVHHDELADRVLDLMAVHPAWQLPLGYKDGVFGAARVPSGAYLGDRDMFLFLVDGNRDLDDPTTTRRSAMTTISIHILQTNGQAAPGKLADAEIHFNGGELDGLKLVGFAVWKSREGQGEDVSFPSRQFVVHGERRSFSLLRWVAKREAQERLQRLVLGAYASGRPSNGKV